MFKKYFNYFQELPCPFQCIPFIIILDFKLTSYFAKSLFFVIFYFATTIYRGSYFGKYFSCSLMFMYFIRSNEDYSALEVIGFASSEKFGKFIDS